MKRKTMQRNTNLTLKEACEKYLDNCVQRNLSEFTVLHYRESYSHFYKFFGAEMPLDEMDKEQYDAFLGYLRTITDNDRTIRCYQRNLMTVLRYLMREGYMDSFEMQAVRVGRNSVETYSDDELQILLKKPDLRKCDYLEYQCWVMVNMLFSTGIRQRSLLHLFRLIFAILATSLMLFPSTSKALRRIASICVYVRYFISSPPQ